MHEEDFLICLIHIRKTSPFTGLLQHRSLVRVQDIHDIAQLFNGLESRIVRLITLRLVENNQAPGALVKHTDDHLVEDHLGELALNLLSVEADHLSDVGDLDAAKGLNDLDQVLLEHSVVEATQVVADEGVAAELVAVRGQGTFVFFQRPVRVRARDSLHGLEVLARVLLRLLGRHQVVDVVDEVKHNLAEQHVLQRGGGLSWLVLRVVAVKCLDEVREGRVEVLVHGV